MSFLKSFIGGSTAAPATPAVAETKEASVPAADASSSPLTTCPPVDVKKHEYTEEQDKMIEELREYTKTILLPETDAYYPWECRFLADPGTHARYMRAAKWKMDDAQKRIKGTIEWRREYRPELIEPGEVSPEQESGKLVVSGFDRDGRTILYMYPSRQNTKDSPRQIRHTVYFLERAIDLMPPNQEQVALVIDYKDMTRGQASSLGTGRAVLHVLQNHYVERLGRAFVMNVPWWLNAFFTAVSAFIDPVSREKIRFNPTLTEFIEPSQLEVIVGGSYNFTYKHDIYWPQLNEFCHIAADGTRVADDGTAWVPPAGMGITDAVEVKNAAAKAAA